MDNQLEIEMIAAENTTKYCQENGITEFEYEADSNMEIYTPLAQAYFNTQLINLNKNETI